MSYSFEARRSFGCVKKITGQPVMNTPLSMEAFIKKVNTWAKDGTRVDVQEWIEEKATEILARHHENNYGTFKQALNVVLVHQMTAVEMVLDRIGGHPGNMSEFASCLWQVEAECELDPELNDHWPVRLRRHMPIILSVLDFLNQRCIEKMLEGGSITKMSGKTCFAEIQHSLEEAFLIDTFSGMDLQPAIVAEIQECFRLLHDHCLTTLWRNSAVDDLEQAQIDCICSSSFEAPGIGRNEKDFAKYRRMVRRRICKELRVKWIAESHVGSEGSLVGNGNGFPRRSLLRSNLGRYVQSYKDSP